jgi:hypothetical protein
MQERYTYKKINFNSDTNTVEATDKVTNGKVEKKSTESTEEVKKPRRGRPRKKSNTEFERCF